MGSLSVRAPLVSCLLFVVFLATSDAQVPPGVPEITGTQVIILNKTVTLTCTATGGDPSPSVTWLRDNTVIDDTYTQVGDSVINNYTFVASSREHLAVFECQSANGVLQNPLSRTKFVEVYQPPTTPIITGPTTILSGTPGVWTCFTKGAYPAPKMIMRIENEEFDNTKFTAGSPKFDRANSNYNLTGTLNWSPTMANNNQRIYCDVEHTQTLTAPKTTSLLLTVGSPLEVNAPQPTYKTLTGETITLQCVVTSGTATQIRWFKNNQLLNLGANSRLSGATPTNPSLTIAGVVMSDADNYICQATDGSTTKNTTVINVTVRSKPTTPELTGPTSVQSGTPTTWTCVSRGGNPLQTMSMRFGNQVFTNEVTTSSVLDPQTNTYTVTGTLQWAPTSVDNDGTLYCDVTHPETLNAPQSVNLPLRVVTPPQPPTLTGPTNVKAGTSYTWTCRSVGAFPEQSMSLRLGSTPITNGLTLDSQFNQATKLYTVTRTLTWTPTSSTTGSTLFCDVLHPETLGQTPQTASLPLSVQSQPQTPTLTGPSEVVAGNPETWTCVSKGGNPSPTMSMRIGNTVFNQEASFTSVLDPTTNSYTVTGTLQWAPSREHNQQVLHCDVSHPETLGDTPQTVDLPLKVLSQPQTPTLTGPLAVISGTTRTWTCVSIGGNPAPTMTMRIGNTALSNQLTVSSVLEPSSNTYRVTGTLTWAPTSVNNQQTLFCDVSHPETLENTPQTVSQPLTVYTPPNNPQITGPNSVVSGKQSTWTCVSVGAYPEQSMSMRIGSTPLNNGFVGKSEYNLVSNLYTMTGTLTWSPSSNNDQDTLFCDVTHPETLQTPQTAALPLTVETSPLTPTLTGPSTVISGTTRVWTCISTGGNPEPTMSIRIGNTVLSNELTVASVFDQTTRTYRVTGTLSWAPSSVHNQQTMFCDVRHDTLNTPQTVSLPLTVHTTPRNPVLTGPEDVVAGKEYKWTCVSTGAYPEQTMRMRVGSSSITNGFATMSSYDSVSKLYTMTGVLTWSPSSDNNDDSLFCDVFHTQTLGQTPQTASLTLSVTSSPIQPTLTGPSTVTSGTTNTWTCVSTGGNPEPSMSMRIGNDVFSNGITFTSVLDPTTNTYRVTGTLSWAPGSHHNQMTLFCDVTHDTLTRPQTVNLPLTVLTPPRLPQLTGPTLVVSGKEEKWTCVSVGAYPEQTMSMRLGGNSITQGFVTSSDYNAVTKLYTMTGTLTWTPTSNNNQPTLFCDVFHTQTLGQTPQTTSLQLNVQTSPQTPTISGPTTVISGTTNTWTCVSTGGNPEPTMSIRIGNNVFSSEVNVNSVLDQQSNTYRVTGTLTWAPESYHNQMTIFCDVEQPATMDRPQTVSLPLTVITSPRPPVLRGPSTVEAGEQYTWTCTSAGANPEQTMSMRLGSNAIQQGFSSYAEYDVTSKLYTVTGTLLWTPSGNNNEDTLFCDVFHTETLGQTPQTASLQLLVQTKPNKPTLTGPTTVTAGTSNTWTCLSIGGNPEPEMSMRINNRVFSQEVTVTSVYDQSSKSFRVTGTLNWAPSSQFNQETLYCDVLHEETSDRLQTVNLPLTVISPPNAPVISGPSTIQAGKQTTWTCTSTGAFPVQTMSMRLGGTSITDGFVTSAEYNAGSKLYTVTGTLTWSPTRANNGDTLFCDVFHSPTLGNSPLTASKILDVQNSPQTPRLTGPTTVTAGTSNSWTCVSEGGNPEPSMAIRYENMYFNSEVTTTSTYDDTSKSYRVVGTLTWAPSSMHNLQSLYCEVSHPETLGNTKQIVNLPLTVLSPPRPPVLTGPSNVRAGSPSKWTCTSVGAYPEQTMRMRLGSTEITQGFYTMSEYNAYTKQFMVIGTLEWSPSSNNHGDTLFCDVTHQQTLGQTPQTASLQLSVQASPQRPTLTGPTTTISGTSYSWTCVSLGGFPEASMTMRVGNMVFNNEVQVSSQFDQTARSYRVTGTLSWSPASRYNGETIYCDVTHETLGDAVQTVSLPLVVYTPPSAPVLSGPTTVTSGNSNTWTCVSTGAYPEQQMSMRIGNTPINSGLTYNAVYDSIQKVYKVTGTLVWSPATVNSGDTLFCDVTHTETASPTQTDSLGLTIYTTPQHPILSGPTKMVAGTSRTWTCVSIGGFPQQQMSMRIGATDLSNSLTVNAVFDSNTKLYRVTGTLVWAPSVSHDGEVLSCDVYHRETLGDVPQTVSLKELDVQAALSVAVPKTSYSPKEDEDVTLQCVVTSGVATSISWTKNNVALQVASSDRLSGATPNDPSLTISGVTLADQGNYVCSATDGMSSDSSATVAVQPIEKVWTEHVIITYILDGYNKLVRPRDPLFNITHNLVPRHFLQFDGRNLTMQAMQCMKWNDPRLTWPKGQNKVSLPASEIWIPDVVLLGEKYVPDFSTKVSVTKDGNVIYCPQGPIMASDCEETAGEVHECKFKFLSWSYDLVMLDIHLPNTKSIDSLIDLSMFVEHDTLEISSRCAVRNEMTYSCRDGTYAELTYTLSVRRRRQFCRNYNKNPSCN